MSVTLGQHQLTRKLLRICPGCGQTNNPLLPVLNARSTGADVAGVHKVYTVMTLSQGETLKFETEPTQDVQVSRLRHEEPGPETVPRQDVSPDSIAVTCTLKVSYTW